MIKRKVIETTEKFDENEKLIERIVREETEEDDTDYQPIRYDNPLHKNNWWEIMPTCEGTVMTNG